MKTIETIITVLPDGSIQIPPHPDLPPGEHHAVLMVEEQPALPPQRTPKPPLKLHVRDWSNWPADFRFRREDLYDDDGR